MNDKSVPLTTVTVYVLWTLVIATLGGAWAARLAGYEDAAFLLAATMCALIGLAAVFTIRCMVARAVSSIRLLCIANQSERSSAELHPIR